MVDVSEADVRAVMALVREVCDRWDDPAVWRAHLLTGACALVEGNVGTIAGQTFSADGGFGTPEALAAVGMPEEVQREAFKPAIQITSTKEVGEAVAAGMPGLVELFGRFSRDGWATAARAEMTDDATHYASPFHRFRAMAGCDDYIMSVRSVDEPGRIEVLAIDRPPDAPRFGGREVMLVKLLHDEIAPLVGVRLATEEHLCRDGLSRRLREVLTELLEGRSEKEVAQNLGLGLPTAHEYVGMLYRHFKVRTRGELMAYFVKRRPREVGGD